MASYIRPKRRGIDREDRSTIRNLEHTVAITVTS
jgi:hypothetical protein